jgi:hypothetical protein
MSDLVTNQSNLFGFDVLQMIFQHLEGEDLVNCEAVCRQWRDILLGGTPWRRLFHRNKEKLPLWRKTQKKLVSNKLTLRTEQYRDVCRKILLVNQNWRTGHFTKFTYPTAQNSAFNLTMSDDYVAWGFVRIENEEHRRGCVFLDTDSMEITEIPLLSGYNVLNEMLVLWANSTRSVVEVRDPKNNWTVTVMNEDENVFHFCQMAFGSKLLVQYYHLDSDRERMKIWKLGNPSILLHDRICESDRNLEILKVDKQFIVARAYYYWKPMTDILYFISTETLDVFTSLSVMRNCEYEYNRGLLFQYRGDGIIRILDLPSGTYFNDVHLPFRKEDKQFVELLSTWASTNSNVIVIGWKYVNKETLETLSQFSVYDLEAVKKRNSKHGCHLLYTLQYRFKISSFVMDDTRIAYNGNDEYGNQLVILLNFDFVERESPELKGNREANEDIKEKIIYDHYVEAFPSSLPEYFYL